MKIMQSYYISYILPRAGNLKGYVNLGRANRGPKLYTLAPDIFSTIIALPPTPLHAKMYITTTHASS